MKYELYLDSFFLLNFFMDTLLLQLLRKLLRCTATQLRICLGAAFGAAAACILTLLPILPIWLKLFAGYALIGLCMIRISFPRLHRRAVIRAGIYLYGLAFLLGGVLEFLTVQLPQLRACGMGIMGICMTGAVFCALLEQLLEHRRRRRERKLYSVRLIWQERSVLATALLDTGNSLYEPISGKAVSIAEQSLLTKLFAGKTPEGIRAIPYHSIGKRHGILLGYELSALQVDGEHEVIRIEKPLVGAFDGKLSGQGVYQMILHPTLTERQEEQG